MKKLLLFMLVSVMLFVLVACGEPTVKEDNTTVLTEEQKRIDENNAVIQPKLDELEETIVAIETVVADNNLGEKYQTVIDQLREELDGVTKNHETIIEMGGYLEGTAEFEAAIEEAIKLNKEMLALINEELASGTNGDELVDKYNELADLVNEVTVKAQENGWSENEELLSDLGAVYGLLDELGEKLASSDEIEEAYKTEKVGTIDQLLPIFEDHLVTVSEPITE